VGKKHFGWKTLKMSRIHVIVEGPTEETFVRDVIVPYFAGRQIYITYSIVHTKIVVDGPNFVGGTVSYDKFKYDATKILRNPSINLLTTMFDLYGLSSTYPGRSSVPTGTALEKVSYVETQIAEDIGSDRFYCYLGLHEFEALLFSNPAIIQDAFPETNCLSQLQAIRNQFQSPEDINDRPQYAPSKRLLTLFGDEYQKTVHGPLIAETIGLDVLRTECPHFNEWISTLESQD
jgi:hypothetical protein